MLQSSVHPLVSVLTPSFNQAQWLVDNLQSVQAQTYPNIEQIVMDGGSSDQTVELLKNAPSNVRWVSEADNGQSDALNKAFDLSQGDIIGWINSDDAYVDNRVVAAAVKAFQADPDLGVVYGHGLVLNEHNVFMTGLWSPRYQAKLVEFGVLFLQPSLFYRRTVLPTKLVDEHLHYVMDWSLFLDLKFSGAKFQRIPYVVGVDRQQAMRKTLNFVELDREISNMLAERGMDYGRIEKVARKTITVVRRLAGVPMVARLHKSVQPAIPIDFLTTKQRLAQQVLLPRRFIK